VDFDDNPSLSIASLMHSRRQPVQLDVSKGVIHFHPREGVYVEHKRKVRLLDNISSVSFGRQRIEGAFEPFLDLRRCESAFALRISTPIWTKERPHTEMKAIFQQRTVVTNWIVCGDSREPG
jgi:hypothetical protein